MDRTFLWATRIATVLNIVLSGVILFEVMNDRAAAQAAEEDI